jgi:hypothetical protein
MHMGIRKPIGVCLAAVGLAAVLVSGPAAAEPPKMTSPGVTKGIKPLKPKEEGAAPAASAKPPEPVKPKDPEPAKPAPATSAPAPSTSAPAPAASGSAKPVASAAPAASAASPAADPGLGALKSGKLQDRLDALRMRIESRKKTAPERKKVEAERTRTRWGAIVEQGPVRAELENHSKRVARLERIQELALVEGRQALADRAAKALAKENTRHETRMAVLAVGGGK